MARKQFCPINHRLVFTFTFFCPRFEVGNFFACFECLLHFCYFGISVSNFKVCAPHCLFLQSLMGSNDVIAEWLDNFKIQHCVNGAIYKSTFSHSVFGGGLLVLKKLKNLSVCIHVHSGACSMHKLFCWSQLCKRQHSLKLFLQEDQIMITLVKQNYTK